MHASRNIYIHRTYWCLALRLTQSLLDVAAATLNTYPIGLLGAPSAFAIASTFTPTGVDAMVEVVGAGPFCRTGAKAVRSHGWLHRNLRTFILLRAGADR